MDLESQLFDLLSARLKYPGTVSKQDLRQICQGHARPVVQFILSSLVPDARKRLIRLNLAVHKTTEIDQNQTTESVGRLESMSELERKLAKLKRDFYVKSFKKDVITAYESMIRKRISAFTTLAQDLEAKNTPLLSENPSDESDLTPHIEEVMEQLDYLSKETGQKQGLLPGSAVVQILQNADLLSSLPAVLRSLIQTIELEKSRISDRGKALNLAEEAKKQGFVYSKEGSKGSLQREDALQLITKLREKVETQRESQWQQFVEVEEVLGKAKDMRKTYKNVKAAKERMRGQMSPSLRDYLHLELDLQSQSAQLKALEKGLKSLENTQETLQNHLALLRSRPSQLQKTASERDSLLQVYHSLTETNSSYRRNLPKLKLRIKDFILKHFSTKGQGVAEAGKRLVDSVGEEVEAVKEYWPGVIRISAGTGPIGLTSTEARRDSFEDWKLQRVLMALKMPCYTPTSVLMKTLEGYQGGNGVQADTGTVLAEVTALHKQEIEAEGVPLALLRLHDTEELLTKERAAAQDLMDHQLVTWQRQPAQFLVPWIRDEEGLSVKEWVDIWKQSVLQSGYS